MIELTKDPIDTGKIIESVMKDEAGGVDVFIGTIRNITKGKKVMALEFEVYEKMAVAELQKIIDTTKEKWPVLEASVSHAIGRRKIGELAVVIAVSAAHRDAAFLACRYIIDTLKETVPIWKKEIFEDGDIWVAAHP